MNERYVRRYDLPARQYTPGAPVVIAAGTLLEDTQKNRLLAQVKFESITPREITALQLEVRCLGGDGAELGRVEKTYASLAVKHGAQFGQNTAVLLPEGTQTVETAVKQVAFADGAAWTARSGACWRSLDASAPASAPVSAPVSVPVSAPVSAPAAAPVGAAPAQGAAKENKKGKKWLIPVIIALVAAIAAAALLLPGGSTGGGHQLSLPGLGGKVLVPEGSNTVKLMLQENDEGLCPVTEATVRELFPEMWATYLAVVPDTGEDLEEYIKDTYFMSRLIGSEGEDNHEDYYNSYGNIDVRNNASAFRCLLVFDSPTSLCGYAVAAPKNEGGGEWSLTLTREHYDFFRSLRG